jgi:hypothetical protein
VLHPAPGGVSAGCTADDVGYVVCYRKRVFADHSGVSADRVHGAICSGHSLCRCFVQCQRLAVRVRRIGIGRDLTASPLPHHRTDGSRLRRFGRCRPGHLHPNRSVFCQCASRAFIPAAEPPPTPRRRPAHRSTPGRHSSRPFRPSARSRVPTMPSADVCQAVRTDDARLSPGRGHPADLPRSAVIPAVPRRRMDQAPSLVEGGLCGRVPARPDGTTPPIRCVSLAPHLRSPRPADPTSR